MVETKTPQKRELSEDDEEDDEEEEERHRLQPISRDSSPTRKTWKQSISTVFVFDVEGSAIHRRYQSLKRDVRETNLFIQRVVTGSLTGFCTGYVTGRLGKLLLSAVGGAVSVIVLGKYYDCVEVHWEKTGRLKTIKENVEDTLKKKSVWRLLEDGKKYLQNNSTAVSCFASAFLLGLLVDAASRRPRMKYMNAAPAGYSGFIILHNPPDQ